MTRNVRLKHEFVEVIPSNLEEGTLYISLAFGTAIHKCCCGCGNEVVTPLSPTDWRLIFDGESVSLHPSIGNWSFPCKSHYWIEDGVVEWAPRWTKQQIEDGRARDRVAKRHYFENREYLRTSRGEPTFEPPHPQVEKESFWTAFRRWLGP